MARQITRQERVIRRMRRAPTAMPILEGRERDDLDEELLEEEEGVGVVMLTAVVEKGVPSMETMEPAAGRWVQAAERMVRTVGG